MGPIPSLIINCSIMKLFNKRLQKLERQNPDNQLKWIAVTQYAGESKEDAIKLAGHPANKKNRGVIFRRIIESINRETGETVLMKRGETYQSPSPEREFIPNTSPNHMDLIN